MSTGSRKEEFDFGTNDQSVSMGLPGDMIEDGSKRSRAGKSRAPLPSEIAQAATASPLPSRISVDGDGKTRSRKGLNADGSKTSTLVPDSELFLEDKRERRKKYAIIAVVLVVVSFVSLFVDAGYSSFFDFGEVVDCWGIALQRLFSGAVLSDDTASVTELLSQHPAYFRIISRVGITAMTIICGAVLAIAGALYQSAFRNPIASPSMLGVSSAIQLGDVILVLVFTTSAGTQLGYRYLICYICVVVTMFLLFLFTRLMTRRGTSINVVNMLLVATILTQFIGVIVTYATTYLFSYDMWEIYNRLSESLTVNLDLFSWVVLLVTCAVGIGPVLALRFRLNGLNFDDTEMRLLGIDATRLRILALICGTVLLMAAQVQMGTVAMLALVVPHISRMVFGAEFRKQFVGSVMMGATLLVACRIIAGFIPYIGSLLPVSVILNFIILPFFVWMLATQQRGWEQ